MGTRCQNTHHQYDGDVRTWAYTHRNILDNRVSPSTPRGRLRDLWEGLSGSHRKRENSGQSHLVDISQSKREEREREIESDS